MTYKTKYAGESKGFFLVLDFKCTKKKKKKNTTYMVREFSDIPVKELAGMTWMKTFSTISLLKMYEEEIFYTN